METLTTDLDEPVFNGDLVAEESQDTESTGPGDPVDPGEEIERLEGVRLPALPERAAVAPSTFGLRDAAEASFPIPPRLDNVLESVIGDDSRRQITDTDDFPWRVHCSLRITARDNSAWLGTAFFIGRRVLATAGHNLFINGPDEARNGWVRSIEVMPGRDGDELPFGMTAASRFYSVRGWSENADPEYDYGAIVLPEGYQNRTGWLGFGAYSDDTLTRSTGNLSGYPADLGNGMEQWYMARRVSSVGTRRVFYDIDTFGGQSGSAVYRIVDGSRYAFGIHAYGVGSNPHNSATRINRPVFDNLKAWKTAHP